MSIRTEYGQSVAECDNCHKCVPLSGNIDLPTGWYALTKPTENGLSVRFVCKLKCLLEWIASEEL